MKIVISGSSGLIGSALCDSLSSDQNETIRLVRKNTKSARDAYWNYLTGEIELKKLKNTDVIIHLAGENVAGLWTEAKKEKIEKSRIEGTKFLVKSVLRFDRKPSTFICASATGIYGSRGSEILNEESKPGDGFLADVAKSWEDATRKLAANKIRVVNLRIGIVLSRKGGALEKMLLPFRLGLGGKLGSGKQYMSWIVLDDLVKAVNYIIHTKEIHGAVNIVSPTPVTNEEFTKTMGKVLHRPTLLTVPAFILKTTVPDMADEMFLASTRVLPEKLIKSGFKFQFDNLEFSLKYLLN